MSHIQECVACRSLAAQVEKLKAYRQEEGCEFSPALRSAIQFLEQQDAEPTHKPRLGRFDDESYCFQ